MSEKKKRSGRFWVPNWVADGMLSSLKGGELRTLIALARFAGKDGLAWPAVSTMSDMTGLEDRTVRRHLRRLEKLGLISKVSGGRGGRGVTTKYRLMAQSWMNLTGASSSLPPDEVIVRGTQASGFTGEAPPETRTPASGFTDTDKTVKGDTARHKGGHLTSERGTPMSAEGSEKEALKVYGLEELDRIGNDKNDALRGPLSAAQQEKRRQKMIKAAQLHQDSQPAMVAG